MDSIQQQMLQDIEAAEKAAFEAYSRHLESLARMKASVLARKPLSPIKQHWFTVNRTNDNINEKGSLVKTRITSLVKCRKFQKQPRQQGIILDANLPEHTGQWKTVHRPLEKEDSSPLVKSRPMLVNESNTVQAKQPNGKGNHVRKLQWDTPDPSNLRGKKRKNLPGSPCHLCQGVLLNIGLTDQEVKEVCKHKSPKAPPTPPNYWNPAWISPKPK